MSFFVSIISFFCYIWLNNVQGGVLLSSVKQELDIVESEFMQIYLHEMYSLCEGINRECKEIFREATVPFGHNLLSVSPILHSRIYSVLIYAANLKKLAFPTRHRKKNEGTGTYKLRNQRADLFEEILNELPIKEIKNSKVRNTLEHFDEYLDESNVKLDKKHNKEKLKDKHGFAAYNMAFSRWETFDRKVYPIRLYIAEEKKFYNLDWSIDIGKIDNEAKLILERLNDLELLKGKESGGLLIPLGVEQQENE